MAGWTIKRFHLGKSKEVLDTELFALYQAAKTLDSRNERGRDSTTLLDSMAAISRAQSGNACPGQCFAIATIERIIP